MNVVFFVFNRPAVSRLVFERIRAARPSKLFLVSDGPRVAVVDDFKNVAASRKVVESVDWPCEVFRSYADINMGCRRRIASGLTWVFEHVEDAIILEDDCLPDASFFPFCNELLEWYRDDVRVMHISGDNFQNGKRRGNASYYFSKYPHVWGWATWRRAWNLYDSELSHWQLHGNEVVTRCCKDVDERRFWQGILTGVHSANINTWDYVWLYSCWAHNGVSILPCVNLVSNIGFGGVSTHTDNHESPLAGLATRAMRFPLAHPQGKVLVNHVADLDTWCRVFCSSDGLLMRIKRRVKIILNKYFNKGGGYNA